MVTPSHPVQSQSRIHSIDILRALAALAVVVYHARAYFWQGGGATYAEFGLRTLRPDVWLSYASTIFSLGWLGVPLFFTLSGYCIHRNFAAKLAKDGDDKLDLVSFYRRRFVRIYPVYLAALIFAGAVEYASQSEVGLTTWLSDNATTFFLNAIMLQGLITGYFGSNGVFWTLSVEFHLYLFYPIMFQLVKKHGPMAAVLFAAAVSIVTAFFYDGLGLSSWFPNATNGSPLFTNHLLIWMLGAYLAEIHVGRVKPVSGWPWTITWILSLLAGIGLQEVGQRGWSALILAPGSVGLVSLLMTTLTRLRSEQTLAGKILYPLGVASYSLYATHIPVFRAIQALTGGEKADTVLWALVCSGIAAGFALAFFYALERHTIRAPRAAS